MQGHIRERGKRKDGSPIWQARYSDPVRGGTAKVEKTFRSKKDAAAWLIQQQASILTGTHIDPRRGDRPFREVIETWRESWVDLSPKTAVGYEAIIRTHLLPEFGARKVSTITPEVVQRYVNRLSSQGARPGTVRNIYAALRNAFATAVRLKMVALNPCSKVKLPRLPREEMLFLDGAEVAALAEEAGKRNPAWRTLIYVAAYCGLRAGEIAALRRQDVDLLRGVLHVRRSLRDVHGHLSYGTPKNGRTRTVSLPRFLRELLAEHLASATSAGVGPEAPVFTSSWGHVLRHDLFYTRVFKPAVRAALPERLHKLRFHDLRHTAASLAIQSGAHPKLVSERLGHSSIAITMDRYGHLMAGLEEALGEKLDALHVAAQEPASNVVALR